MTDTRCGVGATAAARVSLRGESGYAANMSNPDSTPEAEGRRRLAERDRDADSGERPREYRQAEWTDPDDPLAEARAEAVKQTSDHEKNQPPGMTPLSAEWQREKQMTGQGADQPGLPETWRKRGPARPEGDAGDEGR
jgi:hypothetical protein